MIGCIRTEPALYSIQKLIIPLKISRLNISFRICDPIMIDLTVLKILNGHNNTVNGTVIYITVRALPEYVYFALIVFLGKSCGTCRDFLSEGEVPCIYTFFIRCMIELELLIFRIKIFLGKDKLFKCCLTFLTVTVSYNFGSLFISGLIRKDKCKIIIPESSAFEDLPCVYLFLAISFVVIDKLGFINSFFCNILVDSLGMKDSCAIIRHSNFRSVEFLFYIVCNVSLISLVLTNGIDECSGLVGAVCILF